MASMSCLELVTYNGQFGRFNIAFRKSLHNQKDIDMICVAVLGRQSTFFMVSSEGKTAISE